MAEAAASPPARTDRAPAGRDGERAPRVAVVGISEGATCGVHDHALLLAQALERRGLACTTHWLWRGERSPRAAWREIGRWTEGLPAELAQAGAQVLLLHYSVFSYSHRGIPLFAHPVAASLRRTRLPVLSVMHEFVYPLRLGDWRGNLWGLAQRAALIEVVGLSRGLVVTTEARGAWFESRPWLPRRPTAFAPVFSNLPAPSADPGERRGGLVGLFGYSYQGATVSVVLDALRLLGDRGLELRLLGGPGRDSGAGASWLEAAGARGLRDSLSFTGILPAAALAGALAECDVLLFADAPGPSSRKGTLAGSLASGRPVLALDGPQRWRQMIDARAAEVVEPNAEALAGALAELLADGARRAALGERGRAFAEQMGPAYSAEVVAGLIEDLRPAGEDSQCSRAAA